MTNYKTKLAENCCLVHTQHNFCTQQLRFVGITMIVILTGKICVQKVGTNGFQEVLEAVHFICGVDIVRIGTYIEQCVSLVF